MNCLVCGAKMEKFKFKDTTGFEKVRIVQRWVCPKCGYDKDFTGREV